MYGDANPITLAIGILVYTIILIGTFINIFKYWKHKSLKLGLFYLVSILTLMSRIVFFISQFWFENIRLDVNFTLMILPGSFTIGLALSQINIYIILILRIYAI